MFTGLIIQSVLTRKTFTGSSALDPSIASEIGQRPGSPDRAVRVGGWNNEADIGRNAKDLLIVVSEIEELVWNNRPAYGPAELLLPAFVFAVGERVPGRNSRITEEVEALSVKCVASRFCDHVNYCAAAPNSAEKLLSATWNSFTTD